MKLQSPLRVRHRCMWPSVVCLISFKQVKRVHPPLGAGTVLLYNLLKYFSKVYLSISFLLLYPLNYIYLIDLGTVVGRTLYERILHQS